MEEIKDVYESLYNTIVFDSADWSKTKRLAWIYGIIVGWNNESYEEIKDMWNWSDKTIARNKRLNKTFKESIEDRSLNKNYKGGKVMEYKGGHEVEYKGCKAKIWGIADEEKESKRNAQLIAAAPDLLKACERFVWKCENGYARSRESYGEMKKAIAKAKGEVG